MTMMQKIYDGYDGGVQSFWQQWCACFFFFFAHDDKIIN